MCSFVKFCLQSLLNFYFTKSIIEMDNASLEQVLRLKIASEIVVGNQAAVAFSRAFYMENILIDRLISEVRFIINDFSKTKHAKKLL